MRKAKKKIGDWMVVMTWEESGETFELAIARDLGEVAAIDLMIEKEKTYEGTGRAFTCLQEARNA